MFNQLRKKLDLLNFSETLELQHQPVEEKVGPVERQHNCHAASFNQLKEKLNRSVEPQRNHQIGSYKQLKKNLD